MHNRGKKDWILAFLARGPLDRVRLVKGLFLLWHRSGRNLPGYFDFVPYLYGPFSFEIYSTLAEAQNERLISQAPHPMPNWAPYHLTEKGAAAADGITGRLEAQTKELIDAIAAEVASAGFHDLLRRVYAEAPDFASESVVSIAKR